MAHILHICTECYPAAKAGGMGDVVGALPKYLIKAGVPTSVIIPKYKTNWIQQHQFETIKKGSFKMAEETINYTIQKLQNEVLDFPLYVIDLPGKFDREDIYLDADGDGYKDEPERYMAFQIAVLEWLVKAPGLFDIIHCHDHMTAMIIFLMKYGKRYKAKLHNKANFFTIHNGEYRGELDWHYEKIIPEFEEGVGGLLDWDGRINHLALAIKLADKISTVSPGYMKELIEDSDTLTPLYHTEKEKTVGILNGVDIENWEPTTDEHLKIKLEKQNWQSFKSKNKALLLKEVGLKSRQTIISYIGRFAHQKGVDVLLESIAQVLYKKTPVRFIILGTGDKHLEESIKDLAKKFPNNIAPIITYNEKFAHLIYAGSDFMIMPSRFEPCGLNQMYCMRYGTIPIVHSVGGLKDTVPDISENGNGIAFNNLKVTVIEKAIIRATTLYKNKNAIKALIKKNAQVNFSWSKSAKQYVEQYKQLLN